MEQAGPLSPAVAWGSAPRSLADDLQAVGRSARGGAGRVAVAHEIRPGSRLRYRGDRTAWKRSAPAEPRDCVPRSRLRFRSCGCMRCTTATSWMATPSQVAGQTARCSTRCRKDSGAGASSARSICLRRQPATGVVRPSWRSTVSRVPSTTPPVLARRSGLPTRRASSASGRARTCQKQRRRYESHGLVGLVDRRLVKPRRGVQVDPRVRETVLEVIDEYAERSNMTRGGLRLCVQGRLDIKYGQGELKCPPRTTFRRLLDEIPGGRNVLRPLTPPSSDARRPQTPYRHFATTRPGEYVQIDSTRLDVLALHPTARGRARACRVALRL